MVQFLGVMGRTDGRRLSGARSSQPPAASSRSPSGAWTVVAVPGTRNVRPCRAAQAQAGWGPRTGPRLALARGVLGALFLRTRRLLYFSLSLTLEFYEEFKFPSCTKIDNLKSHDNCQDFVTWSLSSPLPPPPPFFGCSGALKHTVGVMKFSPLNFECVA